MSSVVADPASITGGGLDAIEGLAAASVADAEAARAQYSIALAGRVPPPAVEPRLVATGLAEPRRWLELYGDQQEMLARQHQYLQGLDDRNAELSALHAELRKSETEIARLASVDVRLHQAEERLDIVRAELVAEVEATRERSERVLAQMRASPSWRVTAPLRALKRLLG